MITIVSGLPRSGTSLMMQILEANGFEILKDDVRKADESNPLGYYEYAKVKSLIKDNSWLEEAEGKAVKIIAQLIPHLPLNFDYKVIFMERNIDEILASQSNMIKRLGSQKKIPTDLLRKTFLQQVVKTKAFINNLKNYNVAEINFSSLFTQPDKEINRINLSLGFNLSSSALKRIVKPELYRERIFTG